MCAYFLNSTDRTNNAMLLISQTNIILFDYANYKL